MTDQPTLSPRLARLGDALHAAAAEDLAAARPVVARAPQRRRPARRVVIAIAAAAVLLPGGAVAATALLSTHDVEQSIPSGTLALLNTHPTCTTVTDGVEYDCTLASAPVGDVGAGQWLSTVEPTVDATKHVNGGCRSLSADGRHWRCYIGQKAVDEKIIGAGFLGEFAPSPGVG